MKAIIWTAYGPPDVLKLQDVPRPEPQDGELLIRVQATSVTAGDCETRAMVFQPPLGLAMRLFIGVFRPSRRQILGQELAGVVEAVGPGVTTFAPGDPVLAATGLRFGGYAEYATMPAESDDGLVMKKPDGVSWEDAAVLPTGGLEALHFMREAHAGPGKHILINGAGGSIGTYSVQLAKLKGAEVTAVDTGPKLDMLRELGADHVIDYKAEDFTRLGQSWDAVLDVVGKTDYNRTVAVLAPGGVYLQANPRGSQLVRNARELADGKRFFAQPAGRDPADLGHLLELIEAGTLKAVIGHRFPLEQMVEAHRLAESEGKIGNIAISVGAGE